MQALPRSRTLVRVSPTLSLVGSAPPTCLRTSHYRPLTSMTSPAIPDSELKSLATQVKKKFDLAVDAGDAFFYPSEQSRCRNPPRGVLWQIRTVPALLKKPKANDATSQQKEEEEAKRPEQNKSDVFAPPYVPNLHVRDLGPDHVCC